MKTLKNILITVLVAAVLCTGGYLGIQYMKASQTTNVVLDIEGAVHEIGEMSTAEYIYTITDTCEKPNKKIIGLKIPLTASSIIYSYNGIIKAGFDFTEVVLTVDDNVKRIDVTLPQMIILSNEIDNTSLRIYDEKNNPFNQIRWEDMNQSQAELKEKAAKKAVESGLMETAEENAKNILLSTISSLCNLEEYEVVFH